MHSFLFNSRKVYFVSANVRSVATNVRMMQLCIPFSLTAAKFSSCRLRVEANDHQTIGESKEHRPIVRVKSVTAKR